MDIFIPFDPPDLVRRYQPALDSASHIFTWTKPEELAWLAHYASQCQRVVEIGTYMGHSAKVMSNVCPGIVYSVDPFDVAGTRHVFHYFLYYELGRGKVVPIYEDSEKGSQAFAKLGVQADMVFIDDGHRYEDVVRDIQCWLPLLRERGLLCGHDFEDGPNEVGRAVIDSLKGDYTRPVGSLWAHIKP